MLVCEACVGSMLPAALPVILAWGIAGVSGDEKPGVLDRLEWVKPCSGRVCCKLASSVGSRPTCCLAAVRQASESDSCDTPAVACSAIELSTCRHDLVDRRSYSYDVGDHARLKAGAVCMMMLSGGVPCWMLHLFASVFNLQSVAQHVALAFKCNGDAYQVFKSEQNRECQVWC